jgi:spore germination protein GerM
MLGPHRPQAVSVYFVHFDAAGRTGSLVAVARPVAAATSAPGESHAARVLTAAFDELLAGPTPEEIRQGIVTEIPKGTVLRSARVDRAIALVDLSRGFAGGGGSASMLARVWQVVYTATQIPGVDAVQILVDGHHVDALGGEGVMIGTPLHRPSHPPTF